MVLLLLVHLIIVVTTMSQEGAIWKVSLFQDVFDPSKLELDNMAYMFEIRNFVAKEWPHILVWNLFVGRTI